MACSQSGFFSVSLKRNNSFVWLNPFLQIPAHLSNSVFSFDKVMSIWISHKGEFPANLLLALKEVYFGCISNVTVIL